MSKKFSIVLLAFVLLLTMTVPVFAAGLGSESGTVGVIVDADNDGIPDNEEDPEDIDPSARVYSVNVTWESLEFMFSGSWDPEGAKYIGSWMTKAGEEWVADSTQLITVENRSNAAIIVSATMDTTEKNGVSASFGANAAGFTLGSAAEVGAIVNGVGPYNFFEVIVSGNPTVSGSFNVGQITVSFTAAD